VPAVGQVEAMAAEAVVTVEEEAVAGWEWR
jgi:hypothetical protein